ncbi:hypothetical protein H8F10_10545 [Vibrio fluvialis]|uniref:hypothetical protein n=1 Tax=Vibrio fluvialis TaxID=676 RepID=UPI00192C0E1E|nr:hypothetical protein [Vibrio fluvialis]MBL4278352.1 hypothetical protein [Vibrio fluvialis]
MKRIHFLAGLLLLSIAKMGYAFEHSSAKPGDVAFLVSSCQEYIELYKKKDDPRFGAYLTTSKEESFRAGYCLGAVMHANNTCGYGSNSVYRSAEVIASIQDSYYSETELLEDIVCR